MNPPRIFTWLRVYSRVAGGTLVEWTLDKRFLTQVVPPYSFEIYGSRSGVGDWELLGSTGDNAWWLFDHDRHLYALSPRYSYFVRLIDADDHVYDSEVRQATGNFTAKQDPLVRAMLKHERLWHRLGGTCMFLYKRRQWGIPCPVCVDFDTNDVVGGNECQVCYGTGITGGYFDPLTVYAGPSLRAQVQSRHMRVEEPRGTVDDQTTFKRLVACPWIDSRDCLIQADTDMRFQVMGVQAVEYRGTPVIYDPLTLRVLPTSDIFFAVPRPDVIEAPSSSSSSSP